MGNGTPTAIEFARVVVESGSDVGLLWVPLAVLLLLVVAVALRQAAR